MTNEATETNPLMCDPDTGLCEVPAQASLRASGDAQQSVAAARGEKPVRILYFTDPICSACWGIEPQLRKLKMEYGEHFDLDYRMGGLLKSWESYGGGDVSGPESVAEHWEEASAYYGMPIDGGVWKEDPLASSYPPSIAFKAAQMQDEGKAIAFLRRIREMVFLEKKNIARWAHLEEAAAEVGLDKAQFKTDFEGGAIARFDDDLALARTSGVRGFPTLIFLDRAGNRLAVVGFRPYAQFENVLLSLHPDAKKASASLSPEALFARYATLTTKEFAVLANMRIDEASRVLEALADAGGIGKRIYATGVMWERKKR